MSFFKSSKKFDIDIEELYSTTVSLNYTRRDNIKSQHITLKDIFEDLKLLSDTYTNSIFRITQKNRSLKYRYVFIYHYKSRIFGKSEYYIVEILKSNEIRNISGENLSGYALDSLENTGDTNKKAENIIKTCIEKYNTSLTTDYKITKKELYDEMVKFNYRTQEFNDTLNINVGGTYENFFKKLHSSHIDIFENIKIFKIDFFKDISLPEKRTTVYVYVKLNKDHIIVYELNSEGYKIISDTVLVSNVNGNGARHNIIQGLEHNELGGSMGLSINELLYQYGIDKSGGRKKSTKLPKKEILGKLRCIYKVPGSKKDHIKHKGQLISVTDYKKLMKAKPKNLRRVTKL